MDLELRVFKEIMKIYNRSRGSMAGSVLATAVASPEIMSRPISM